MGVIIPVYYDDSLNPNTWSKKLKKLKHFIIVDEEES